MYNRIVDSNKLATVMRPSKSQPRRVERRELTDEQVALEIEYDVDRSALSCSFSPHCTMVSVSLATSFTYIGASRPPRTTMRAW